MRRLRALGLRLRAMVGGPDSDQDLTDELESVVQMHVEDNLQAGMTPEEARRQALIRLGGVEQVRQAVRDQTGLPSLEGLGRDLKHAARALVRTPGFSTVAILIMAVGIGAGVSLFTVVHSILLRPLPFPHPDRLVAIYSQDDLSKPDSYNNTASGDFYDWQRASLGYQQMAIWRWSGYNMSSGKGELPEFLNAGACSWNLFSTLGVSPVLGRPFTLADDKPGVARTAILSWSFFARRFNHDPAVLGKTIRLNGQAYTVIGILPDWFQYPNAKIQLWVPWQIEVPRDALWSHYYHIGSVIARLKAGVSATAPIQEVSAAQYEIYLRFNGTGPVEQGAIARPLLEDMVGDVKTLLYVLLAAVICLLLVACLNLSNLLVARSAVRRRELAIRTALGSSRLSLIRQQLTESLLICFIGGVLGVLFATAGTRWVTTHWEELPRAYGVHLDSTAVAFALVMTLLAGLLAGLWPGLSASSGNILSALQEGTRGIGGSVSRTSTRRALLTGEVALTVVLLVAAGLLFKSFLRLRGVDLGCTTKNVLTMNYFLRGDKYSKPEQIVSFDTQLLDKVRHLPGVEAAGLTNVVPGDGDYGAHEIWIPEHPAEAPGEHHFALYRTADPDFFSTLEIPLIRGRFFSENERLEHDKYVIVNQELVWRFFPAEDPIGKHLRVEWRTPQGENYEIVGVVGDTSYRIGRPARPMMWFPILAGIPGNSGDSVLVVRAAKEVTSLATPIQKMIASLDPELPVNDILTMEQIVGESTANSSFTATLVLSFAGLSLLLAAVGLYGVLAYLVTQRTPEIGIRMALGAERERVLRLMLLDGLRPALIGLGLGLGASIVSTRLIRSVLYGTSPVDVTVFVLVSATLLISSIAACLVPAWRAARIDPMHALRSE
jgi:predicted permease